MVHVGMLKKLQEVVGMGDEATMHIRHGSVFTYPET